jgi:hypothetical protein
MRYCISPVDITTSKGGRCLIQQTLTISFDVLDLITQYCSTFWGPGCFHRSLNALNMITLFPMVERIPVLAVAWFEADGTAWPLASPAAGQPVSTIRTGYLCGYITSDENTLSA